MTCVIVNNPETPTGFPLLSDVSDPPLLHMSCRRMAMGCLQETRPLLGDAMGCPQDCYGWLQETRPL